MQAEVRLKGSASAFPFMDALTMREAVRDRAAHSSLTDDQDWAVKCFAAGFSKTQIARMSNRSVQAVDQMLNRAAGHFDKKAA